MSHSLSSGWGSYISCLVGWIFYHIMVYRYYKALPPFSVDFDHIPICSFAFLFSEYVLSTLCPGFSGSPIDILVLPAHIPFLGCLIFTILCTSLNYLRYKFSDCYGLLTELHIPIFICKLEKRIYSFSYTWKIFLIPSQECQQSFC